MKCPLDLSPDTFKRESITDPREKGCWRGKLEGGGHGWAWQRESKRESRWRTEAKGCTEFLHSLGSAFWRNWACLSHFQSILNTVALLIFLNHCSLLITPLIKSKKCPLLPAKSNPGFSASPALTSGIRPFPAVQLDLPHLPIATSSPTARTPHCFLHRWSPPHLCAWLALFFLAGILCHFLLPSLPLWHLGPMSSPTFPINTDPSQYSSSPWCLSSLYPEMCWQMFNNRLSGFGGDKFIHIHTKNKTF